MGSRTDFTISPSGSGVEVRSQTRWWTPRAPVAGAGGLSRAGLFGSAASAKRWVLEQYGVPASTWTQSTDSLWHAGKGDSLPSR